MDPRFWQQGHPYYYYYGPQPLHYHYNYHVSHSHTTFINFQQPPPPRYPSYAEDDWQGGRLPPIQQKKPKSLALKALKMTGKLLLPLLL